MQCQSLMVLLCIPVILVLASEPHALESDWIDPARGMVVYNKARLDSVDPAEVDSFSRDTGEWYMKRHGMPVKHLFGYDMGTRVKWENPGAFDFLKAIADYIEQHDIQVVLLAPGTPLLVRDVNNKARLALDSLAGHALWFVKVLKVAPACTAPKSIVPNNSNLYFPYVDMKDGASPFVAVSKDAAMAIPLENTAFVKALVNGGMAATTSIKAFNGQSDRSLLFYGRENNSGPFIDVGASINEAMAQDAIMQGVAADRIVRVASRGGGWNGKSCLEEPDWDYSHAEFRDGRIKPVINPLIFSAGGIGNTTEAMKPWTKNLDVQPGLVASAVVSNGRSFAGSILKRGATAAIVNIQHPQNARTHAWFSVFRQLVGGATMAEAMISSGGSGRGGYITGSVWGDPLYAPFGKNPVKLNWFIGGNGPD